MPIIINNLSHVYNAGTPFEKYALKNIDLIVEDGEFIGIIGHTGSGKSTLIQHLNVLLKPSEGTITIDGFDINSDKSKLKKIRQKVGLVFQYPEHQLFELTVFREVAYGPTNMKLAASEIDERVRYALKMVGIDEAVYQKSPFELSGGQKRRVAIASVLAMKPDILILDEPTAGLDPRARNEFLDYIAGLHQSLGITVMLVSHSMEDVSRVASRLIVMENGGIAFDGRPENIFPRVDELESMGLSSPQIFKLMKKLKEAGFTTPEPVDCLNIETAARSLHRLLTNQPDI